MVKFLLTEGTWQHQHWDQDFCTVVSLSGGGYGVLDHSIQTLVATGETSEECQRWINGNS